MKNHRDIQLLLYDHLQGTLPEREGVEVDRHLRECEECRAELEDIRSILASLPEPGDAPGEHMPESYWKAFGNVVEGRIRRDGARQRNSRERMRSVAGEFLLRRWKPLVAASWTLALVLLVFLLTRQRATESVPLPDPVVAAPSAGIDSSAVRVQQYLRKSKSLLVGLTNMKVTERSPVDLSAERRTSRELAAESRLLRHQPLDARGKRLVGDLEKIFIELANATGEESVPAVDIVRAGIERENLLFKIRMAETAYGNARVVPAGMQR
jgi:Putative zinc-finger